MTSSFMVQQRLKNGQTWKFGDERDAPGLQTVMGGSDNSYIRPWGNCVPGYKAYPIGFPDGVKMCVRQTTNNQDIDQNIFDMGKNFSNQFNGYYRGSVNLYNPSLIFPVQDYNPQFYSDRRIPWEQDVLRADYLKWPVRYNGTGIRVLHAPAEKRDTGHPYYQYGYDFTPKHEDPATGMRTTHSNKSFPEMKYDITRLPQPYEIWRKEQSIFGDHHLNDDETYFKRII